MNEIKLFSSLNVSYISIFRSHAINLMTNLRPECYGELVPTGSTTTDDTYEGQDVSTLTVLLGYLEERLGKVILFFVHILQFKNKAYFNILLLLADACLAGRTFTRTDRTHPMCQ